MFFSLIRNTLLTETRFLVLFFTRQTDRITINWHFSHTHGTFFTACSIQRMFCEIANFFHEAVYAQLETFFFDRECVCTKELSKVLCSCSWSLKNVCNLQAPKDFNRFATIYFVLMFHATSSSLCNFFSVFIIIKQC